MCMEPLTSKPCIDFVASPTVFGPSSSLPSNRGQSTWQSILSIELIPYTSSPSLDLTMPPCLEGLSLLALGIDNTFSLCFIYTQISDSTSATEDFKRRILQPDYWFGVRFELAEDLDIARGVRRGRTCVDLSSRNDVCLTTFHPNHHTSVLNASFRLVNHSI